MGKRNYEIEKLCKKETSTYVGVKRMHYIKKLWKLRIVLAIPYKISVKLFRDFNKIIPMSVAPLLSWPALQFSDQFLHLHYFAITLEFFKVFTFLFHTTLSSKLN